MKKLAISLALATAAPAFADVQPNSPWDQVLEEARGQTVFFNAWGGADNINQYIEWAGEQVERQYGVKLEHVKVGDIAEIVTQIKTAKDVGRTDQGNVDLMWINGENFANLKANDLLFGSFADNLPNAGLVADKPSIKYDFSVAVDGLESPWGGAQLVFIHDAQVTPEPPVNATELLAFAQNGGRFAYPAPPAFHGTTFVKQLLSELVDDPSVLQQPVNTVDFEAATESLWAYLDALHPSLRGRGQVWPSSGEETRQLLDDGEVDIALSFNPNDASAAVRNGLLPDTVRSYVFDGGTIGNTHFVSIPFNASAKAGAMVVANFLLSPEAQARKADPQFWGDPTVLDISRLDSTAKTAFEQLDLGPWALPIEELANTRGEPHASWTQALEQAWLKRYGQ